MEIFKIIFHYEWTQLLRKPAQIIVLIAFGLLGLISVENGRMFLKNQLEAVDSLKQIQQLHLQSIHHRFHTDTATEMGKTLRKQAGIPQVVEFTNPPYAINPPTSLVMLSVGQRDFLPWFDLVNTARTHATPPETEITNPEKLSLGNLDLSFILIYLFPGLIITWCYNLRSQEVEQQTDRLLEIQGGSLNKITDYRLLFRYIIVCILALILNWLAFLSRPVHSILFLSDGLLWQGITLLYITFWFSLCRLVISFRFSSAYNIIILPALWLLLALVLPAFAEQCMELVDPSPSMADLSYKQREIVNETWEMPRAALMDTFYKNNPQYRKLKNVSDTAQYGNKRFAAYHDLLGRRIDASTKAFFLKVNSHNRMRFILNWINPVAQTESLFIRDAESGLQDYYRFEQTVDQFQSQWVAFLNGYKLYDKQLLEADLDRLPKYRKDKYPDKINSLIMGMLPIVLLVLLTLGISQQKFKQTKFNYLNN